MWRVRPFALSVAAGTLLAFPSNSFGLVTIGSNLQREPDIVFACGPCTAVQATLAADSQAPNGIRSPVNGTVTVWRIRSTDSSHGPAALRIVKPLAGDLFTGAGTSSPVDPPPTSITASPTGLPIAIGDTLGLDFSNGNYFAQNPGSTRVSFAPPLTDGGPGRAPEDTFTNREITINADIDPTSAFAISEVKSGKGGKVTVTVTLPNPGTLQGGDKRDAGLASAAGKRKPTLLKRVTAPVGVAGQTIRMLLRPSKRARVLLRERGKLKAKAKVVFTPTGGSPATQVLKVKLKR